ncbi:hypothetical protein SAMN03159341_103191 [Paenibacillus sp. 1_12]|uniref:phage baseplate protein n=1 Tax=Paenibacillus sp. 1_12 TaxID=1566278 RepID=UPI0008E24B13|nr:hypothetical protein [Paenibacillus sp. 1_12]SFL09723.1 hypothetical protein SAMN03159341_103191 [Paenibacillus sp. 1_12]
MATINDYKVMVETEDPSYDIEVTEQPIEDGLDLVDHVRTKARTMNISGFIVGEDAAQTREGLLNLMQYGSIVNYQGRNSFVGILTSFRSSHTHQIENGMSFTASLKEVRTATASVIREVSLEDGAEINPVSNMGRQDSTEL